MFRRKYSNSVHLTRVNKNNIFKFSIFHYLYDYLIRFHFKNVSVLKFLSKQRFGYKWVLFDQNKQYVVKSLTEVHIMMIDKLKFVFTIAVVLNLQWVVSVNAGELNYKIFYCLP